MAPTPEGRAIHLTEERPAAMLAAGTGGPYLLHVALGNGRQIEDDRVASFGNPEREKRVTTDPEVVRALTTLAARRAGAGAAPAALP